MAPASVATLQLAHLPEQPIHVAFFQKVTNAPFIRQQLVQGNEQFEYGFIDATSVLSVNHLLSAVFRALNDHQNGRLKSRNVHSEIVFCLSPNNNIADSFRRFGVTDTTTSLLAVKVPLDSALSAQSMSDHLTASVHGQLVPFSDTTLAECTDLAKIRKLYKVTDDQGGGDGKTRKRRDEKPYYANGSNSACHDNVPLDEKAGLENVVIAMMTLRGA